MSTLVEQIEALQADCRERGDNVDGIYHPVAASAYGSFVGALDPILAAAREQEDELAHWRWLYSDHGEPKKDSKPEQTQHSADLREVAQMALSASANFLEPFTVYYDTADTDVREGVQQDIRNLRDSILAAFREKKVMTGK